MAYQTYTTDAIVCKSRARGNADRLFWLLTHDAGMVLAHAKSVREARSKLRFALQDFSIIRVSLVRGRHDWRVTGAEPYTNLYFSAASREARAALLRSMRLLHRLLPGEEPNSRLFCVAREGLRHLATLESEHRALEGLFMLRVLHELGYVASSKKLETLLTMASFGDAASAMSGNTALESLVERSTDKALEASQL